MATHTITTRDEWLTARLDLLEAEKELTRRSDELARRRRELPWVRVEKEYRFETQDGDATLPDLFRGRSQLIVYHFMFGSDFEAGCPSCSGIADGFDGIFVHLENHDVAFTAISRGPLDKLLAFRERMGWRFPWASSAPGDFNADYGVGFTREEQRRGNVEYNYRRGGHPMDEASAHPAVRELARGCGTDAVDYARERPGMSSFVLEDGAVYHAYSTYSRGVDALWGMYPWLDRAPLGRNESGVWWRRHDEY